MAISTVIGKQFAGLVPLHVYRLVTLFSILWILGIVLFCYAKLVESRSQLAWQLDFTKFHISANALINGDDIYRRVPSDYFGPIDAKMEDVPEKLHPNLNLPFVTVLLSPFGLLDLDTGMAVWTMLSICFSLATAFLLGREIGTLAGVKALPPWIITGVLAIALLVYYPNWIGAALGQLSQLLLLVLTATWISARRGHDRAAGVLFGLALMLKPFTGILLLLLPWLGRWQLLAWYITSAAAFAGIAALIAGPESYLHYLVGLREINWHAAGWNASLMAPITALMGGGDGPGIYSLPSLRLPVWMAVSIVLYALLVIQIRALRPDQIKLDVTVAGSIPLMLLISPLGWLYYFSLIWITVAAVVLATAELNHAARWRWGPLFILVMCGLPYPYLEPGKAGRSAENILTTSGDTVALLIVFLFVVAAGRAARTCSRSPSGTAYNRARHHSDATFSPCRQRL